MFVIKSHWFTQQTIALATIAQKCSHIILCIPQNNLFRGQYCGNGSVISVCITRVSIIEISVCISLFSRKSQWWLDFAACLFEEHFLRSTCLCLYIAHWHSNHFVLGIPSGPLPGSHNGNSSNLSFMQKYFSASFKKKDYWHDKNFVNKLMGKPV